MAFICDFCHAYNGCRSDPRIHSKSFGRCEDCLETRTCSDCHGYRKNGHKERQWIESSK